MYFFSIYKQNNIMAHKILVTERYLKLIIEEVVRENLNEILNKKKELLIEDYIRSLLPIQSKFVVFRECEKPSNVEIMDRNNDSAPNSFYYKLNQEVAGKMCIVRESNHWSQYIIQNFVLTKEMVKNTNFRAGHKVNLVFGTHQTIGEGPHYSIILESSNYNVSVDDIQKAFYKYYNGHPDKYYMGESLPMFLVLNKKTLNLFGKTMICGKVNISSEDNRQKGVFRQPSNRHSPIH
jgi:hypothetical protein